MRNYSSKTLALFIATGIAAISCLFLLLVYLIDIQYKWTLIVFSVIFIFTVSFISLFIILKKYIILKLKPIYNTIESLKSTEKDHIEDIENINIISEVNEEVVKWAKKKTKEIALLKANEKYRKEFLGNVSHELKTPLFNIQGYVTTLIDGGLYDEGINMKYLERAEKNLNRLISIVEDLEAISKLESGELKLNIDTFNLVTVIEEVFDLHEMRAKERNIILKFSKKPRNPILVKADKTRIFEVVSNLVINSIIYGQENGSTTISIFDIEPKLLVEVTDTGIGIDQKDIKRVFERFYRVDKSRSTQVGGTGLGLSIVKHILEAHGELITVKSKLKEGTTFTFTLKKSE